MDSVPGLVETKIEEIKGDLYRKRIVNTSSKVINKVVAAVLVKVGDKPLDVVSIGTGTKWIEIEEDYDKGKVPDGHAESVAIEGSRLYLDKQIDLCSKDTETEIFKLAAHGKYQLNDGVKFYLYISTAPCGAYREFRYKTKVPESTFRAKINKEAIPQPMDPTEKQIMCCSNKIDLYCVLGFQGRQLCGVLNNPIYFNKILIGYNPNEFEALKFHIESLQKPIINPDLPYDADDLIDKEYRSKLPEIHLVPLPTTRTEDNPQKEYVIKDSANDMQNNDNGFMIKDSAKNISINWNIGSNKVEVTDAKSGKALYIEGNGRAQGVSQLCESAEELSYSTENTTSYDKCKIAILHHHKNISDAKNHTTFELNGSPNSY